MFKGVFDIHQGTNQVEQHMRNYWITIIFCFVYCLVDNGQYKQNKVYFTIYSIVLNINKNLYWLFNRKAISN